MQIASMSICIWYSYRERALIQKWGIFCPELSSFSICLKDNLNSTVCRWTVLIRVAFVIFPLEFCFILALFLKFRLFFFLLYAVRRNPKKDEIITYSVFLGTGMNNVVSNERVGVLDFIDLQSVYRGDIHIRQKRYVMSFW